MEFDGGKAGGGVGNGVGHDEYAVVNEGAAGVDDIGHVAVALVEGGAEEGFFETSDNPGGIIAVEEDGADAVFAHRADAVGEDKPAGIGLDGRAAVAELGEFPGLRRADDDLRLIPEVGMVGEHEVDVDPVLPAEHGVVAVDFPREEGEALVGDGGAVQCAGVEGAEVGGGDNLREDVRPVVGRVGRVVGDLAVIIGEADEAGVLDAVALERRVGENNFLGEAEAVLETHGIVGFGEGNRALAGPHDLGVAAVTAQGGGAGHQFRHVEDIGEVGRGGAGRVVGNPQFEKFAAEKAQVVFGGGFGSGGVDEFRDRVESHRAVSRGDARAKGDRRDVSLAGGAQAEDEAQFPGGEPGLVGGGHDARVEESAGFEGIFVGEIRTDEKLAALVERTVDGNQRGQFGEAFEEDGANVDMTVVKFRQHAVERLRNGVIVEHEDAGEHIEKPAAGFGMAGRFDHDRGHEGTEEDAACIGPQFERLPAEVHVGRSEKAALALSRAFISARARRKERVDSAPWFWFVRLGCSPSRQPPVAGS